MAMALAAAAIDRSLPFSSSSCILLLHLARISTNLEAPGTHYFWKYSTTLYGTVLALAGCTRSTHQSLSHASPLGAKKKKTLQKS